jgi:VanZ family protein
MSAMPFDIRKILLRFAALAFIGFLIAVVVIADRGKGNEWWPFIQDIPMGDKLGHVGLFGTLAFLCNLAFPDRRPSPLPRFITRTTLVLLTVISAEEIAQAFIPFRSFDLIDWLADLIGLATGQTLALGILKTSAKKPIPLEE